jgi:hypothetical protein
VARRGMYICISLCGSWLAHITSDIFVAKIDYTNCGLKWAMSNLRLNSRVELTRMVWNAISGLSCFQLNKMGIPSTLFSMV